jgi:hypothetical protein
MTDTRSLRDDLRERMNAPGPTVTITKAQLAYLLGQSAPGLDEAHLRTLRLLDEATVLIRSLATAIEARWATSNDHLVKPPPPIYYEAARWLDRAASEEQP